PAVVVFSSCFVQSTATTENSTLSLHDALPILQRQTARRSRGDGRRRSGASGRDDIPQIRAWAESQGMDVSARGRIKKEIIDAYEDRKSTRLNSSHGSISYAVFCLKKKNRAIKS